MTFQSNLTADQPRQRLAPGSWPFGWCHLYVWSCEEWMLQILDKDRIIFIALLSSVSNHCPPTTMRERKQRYSVSWVVVLKEGSGHIAESASFRLFFKHHTGQHLVATDRICRSLRTVRHADAYRLLQIKWQSFVGQGKHWVELRNGNSQTC